MAHDCVTQVCATILEMEGEYVVWPSEEQQRQQEAKFFGMYGEFTMVTAIESLLSSLFTDLRDGTVRVQLLLAWKCTC